MQVEAIYDNGRLEFTRPIQLKHQRIRVRVDIPDTDLADDEPATSPESAPAHQEALGTGDIRERVCAILGADWEKLAQPDTTPEKNKAIWHQHLKEKHLGSR